MKRQMALAVLSLITSTAAVRGETWPGNWRTGRCTAKTCRTPSVIRSLRSIEATLAHRCPHGRSLPVTQLVHRQQLLMALSMSAPGTDFLRRHRCHNWPASVEGPIGPANRRSFLFPRFAGGLRLERRPRAAFRPPGGIVLTSSAAVVDGHVYFGGGLYALIALQRTMGT